MERKYEADTMRRSDREIKEFDEIVEVIKKCDVCRIALNDGGYPYIVPLNFGMKAEGKQIVLYFHGAGEGKKYELIRRDDRAGFEMDCSHRLVAGTDGCSCTMKYESVVGRGRIEIVPEEEKTEALSALMGQYHAGKFSFPEEAVRKTTVMKLTVEQVSGKKNLERV